MYGQGSQVPTVVPAVLGAGTVAVLPQTGMNSATHVAVAAAAGLATWALVYMAQSLFKR